MDASHRCRIGGPTVQQSGYCITVLLCYIRHTFFLLRLYEAIRSTLPDRLRYTIVHWICVISVQTCTITSNCCCPKFQSYRTYLAVKQWMLNKWSQTDRLRQHMDGILIPFIIIITTDRSVVRTNDLRIVSCGCIILKTRGCRKTWLYRSPMSSHCNGQTCSNTPSLPGIQSLDDP